MVSRVFVFEQIFCYHLEMLKWVNTAQITYVIRDSDAKNA